MFIPCLWWKLCFVSVLMHSGSWGSGMLMLVWSFNTLFILRIYSAVGLKKHLLRNWDTVSGYCVFSSSLASQGKGICLVECVKRFLCSCTLYCQRNRLIGALTTSLMVRKHHPSRFCCACVMHHRIAFVIICIGCEPTMVHISRQGGLVSTGRCWETSLYIVDNACP